VSAQLAAEPVTSQARLGELVEAARAGDQDAFGQIVQALWTDLVAFARSVLGRAAEAEDIVQEAFLIAWQELPALRAPGSIRSWVWKIVYRRAVLHLKSRPPTLPLEAAKREAIHLVTPEIDMERALAALAPQDRAIVYLSLVEEWKSGEIGAALGLSGVTVRIYRMRALSRLRTHFGVKQP